MPLLMICLGKPEETDCDILRLLDVLLSNDIDVPEKQQVLENDFNIPMTRELERGVNDMCNLGVAIEREGIAKGRAEGITEWAISDLKILMRNTGWSLERAMTTLSVPQEEWGKYIDLLAKQ